MLVQCTGLRMRSPNASQWWVKSQGWMAWVWGTLSSTALSTRSEEHTSELQSRGHLVCRLLLTCYDRDLTAFPTRRSSDLESRPGGGGEDGDVAGLEAEVGDDVGPVHGAADEVAERQPVVGEEPGVDGLGLGHVVEHGAEHEIGRAHV